MKKDFITSGPGLMIQSSFESLHSSSKVLASLEHFMLRSFLIPILSLNNLIHCAGQEIHLVGKCNGFVPLPATVPPQHRRVRIVHGFWILCLVLELPSSDDGNQLPVWHGYQIIARASVNVAWIFHANVDNILQRLLPGFFELCDDTMRICYT